MEIENTIDLVDELFSKLDDTKRKTNGRDKSKTYHKVTISVNEKQKNEIINYASTEGISVSELIKNLLKEKGVFD